MCKNINLIIIKIFRGIYTQIFKMYFNTVYGIYVCIYVYMKRIKILKIHLIFDFWGRDTCTFIKRKHHEG